MDPADLLTPEGMLRRLHWQVIRRLNGRLQGDYRTLLRGDGTDFLDLRAYEWGDDVRHIDWNATARMDELLVRDFMEDRELTAWLLLDRSRSMAFGPAGRTKEHVLCELAAVFAQVFVRNGNRVGAIIFDGARHWVLPPRQGRNHVLVLMDNLLRPVEAAASTDLATLFGTAEQLVRRRSLVVVISDFVSEPGWERPLLRLTRRHEVVAVRTVDPRDANSPPPACCTCRTPKRGRYCSSTRATRRSAAVCTRWLTIRKRPSAARSPGPASTSTSCRPRTICCGRSCGWLQLGGRGADDLRNAGMAVDAAGRAGGGGRLRRSTP